MEDFTAHRAKYQAHKRETITEAEPDPGKELGSASGPHRPGPQVGQFLLLRLLLINRVCYCPAWSSRTIDKILN